MRLMLLAYLFGAPQSVIDTPTPADDWAIHWPNGYWDYPTSLDKHSDFRGTITICGPWHGGRHVVYATLQSPTRQQITSALATAREAWAAERTVSRTAVPKGFPLASAGETVDPDLSRAGPLPDGFDISGMTRYRRATMTQEIAVVNNHDSIVPVSRLPLHARDARWLVSGGLLGIGDWRSDLYRNEAAANSREYVGNIGVLNSFGYTQRNRGWRREFADGSRFLDVLSSGGKVFEVRQRLKQEGRWNNEVIFEDEKARPVGYLGLTKSCASCHAAKDGPGSGPYAGPLVTGSDQTFSFPFKALEK